MSEYTDHAGENPDLTREGAMLADRLWVMLSTRIREDSKALPNLTGNGEALADHVPYAERELIRDLVGALSRAVGYYIGGPHSPFWAVEAQAILDRAREAGY
tara:strand:+ start:167 stop:472 length:306 start_codon:yes stop_codon:yes gene_type:complete